MLEEISALANNQNKRSILPSVRLYISGSAEPLLNQMEHLIPLAVLAHVELRYQLITGST